MNSDNRSPGQRVLDEIIKQNMVSASDEDRHLLIWNRNTVDQLDAVIAEASPVCPVHPVIPIHRMWAQQDRQESIDSRFGKGNWSVPDLYQLLENEPEFDLPLNHIDLGSYDFDGEAGGLIGFARHYLHVRDADLSVPVIMDEWGRIIDGRHRITKALVEGVATVRCKRVPPGSRPTRNPA